MQSKVTSPTASLERHLNSILRMIETSEVSEVVSPTGSGKSTIIPRALANKNKVFLSAPTIAAVRGLYNRVSSTSPDLKVGYAAQSEVHYNNSHRLVYATSGHLMRKMYEYFSGGLVRETGIDFCDILILDEIHTGNTENTMIMSLWMEARRQERYVPKLVLMTATPVAIETDLKRKVFNVEEEDISRGYASPYSVEVKYKSNYKNVSKIFESMIEETVYINTYNPSEPKGHVLLFVPGSGDVVKIVDTLYTKLPQNVVVIGIHGGSNKEDIEKVHQPVSGSVRKIIVATNVAESSITIDNLQFVLDSMLEKRPGTSTTGGLKLTTSHISKKSADQRKGRTGRTRSGTCIRFISEAAYQGLENNKPFEIDVVPIHNEILQLISLGLDPSLILRSVDTSRIIQTMRSLASMEMLEKGQNDVPQVSRIGLFGSNITLSVRQTYFLWKWIEANGPSSIYMGVVIACLIDSEPHNIFKWPKRNQGESQQDFLRRSKEHFEEYFDKFLAPYDDDSTQEIEDDHLITCLTMFREVHSLIGKNILTKDNKSSMRTKISKWCKANSTGFMKIDELIRSIRLVVTSTTRFFNLTSVDFPDDFSPVLYAKSAEPLLASINRDMIVIRSSRGDMYTHVETGLKYRISRYGIPGNITRHNVLVALGSIVSEAEDIKGIISMAIAGDKIQPLQPKQDIEPEEDTLYSHQDFIIMPPNVDVSDNEELIDITSNKHVSIIPKELLKPTLDPSRLISYIQPSESQILKPSPPVLMTPPLLSFQKTITPYNILKGESESLQMMTTKSTPISTEKKVKPSSPQLSGPSPRKPKKKEDRPRITQLKPTLMMARSIIPRVSVRLVQDIRQKLPTLSPTRETISLPSLPQTIQAPAPQKPTFIVPTLQVPSFQPITATSSNVPPTIPSLPQMQPPMIPPMQAPTIPSLPQMQPPMIPPMQPPTIPSLPQMQAPTIPSLPQMQPSNIPQMQPPTIPQMQAPMIPPMQQGAFIPPPFGF